MSFDKPVLKTYPVEHASSPDEVRQLCDDGECLSYLYAKEYEQTAANRVYKLKPGKEPYDADDSLVEPEDAGETPRHG